MEDKKCGSLSQGNCAGAVVIFFILLFVFAKWGPAINLSTVTQTKGDPFIVSGEGKVSVTPDIAKVSLGIQQTGITLKQVQNDVNVKSKALTAKLKSLGITENDIKTTSYNVYPQYDYNTSTIKITGYQVSTDYEVTIKDFDKINNVVVEGTAVGANIIGNVSFDINESTKTEKMNEARALAVNNAKSKAEGLAKASGITLGKIVNINESSGRNEIQPMYAATKDLAIGGAPTTANIQPGTTDLNVTVSLSFDIR